MQGIIAPQKCSPFAPLRENKKAPTFVEALCVADSEGFGPPVRLTVRLISSQE